MSGCTTLSIYRSKLVTMNKFGVCFALMMCVWDNLAVSPEQKSLIQSRLLAGGLDCIKQHPLSISEIKSFKNKMLPDKEDAKCFAACLFKKVGLMNDMGKLDPEKVGVNAAEIFKGSSEHVEKSKAFVQECSKVNDEMVSDGAKGCDRAKLAFNCLRDNAPKYGFDVDF